jgi:hypothetical protein
MRNIFLTLMIAGSLFAANTLSVSSVTDDGAGNLTMSLAYNFMDDVSGFQFNLLSDDGAGANVLTLTGAAGGVTDPCDTGCGFTVSSSATTVLGFSFSGAIIPAGSGDFLTLTATYNVANNGTVVNITALEDCDSDGTTACEQNADNTRMLLSDADAQPLESSFISSAWTVGDGTLDNEQPLAYELSANYPNPFNPSTTIDYSIATAGEVNIIVYDMMGREVRTLVSNFATPGSYSVVWDAVNNDGLSVSAGMYVYKMISGDFVEVNKMLLVK